MAPKKKTKAEIKAEAEAAEAAAAAAAAEAERLAEEEARRVAEEARLVAEAEEARLKAIEDAKAEKRAQVLARAELRNLKRLEAEAREALKRDMERPRPSPFAVPPWREQLHSGSSKQKACGLPEPLKEKARRQARHQALIADIEVQIFRSHEAYQKLRDHQRTSAVRSLSHRLKEAEVASPELCLSNAKLQALPPSAYSHLSVCTYTRARSFTGRMRIDVR